MNILRVFFFALFFLLTSPLPRCAECNSDSEAESVQPTEEASDLGIVGSKADAPDFGDQNFSPAPGIDTVCVFPKNSAKSKKTSYCLFFYIYFLVHVIVTAGQETELLVGLKNDGEYRINIIAIKASVHLPVDHRLLVQNLTAQSFNNATVPASVHATFPYIFAVSKFLQAGSFDLVGTIIYEIGQHPYQSTFYNGTVEVVESVDFNMESVFLVTLGIALLIQFGLWIDAKMRIVSKKTRRVSKIEVGTGTRDASMDEWLQGTAYTKSNGNKQKKKN
ncbi:Translocon-associated protein subunit alpha [Linum perenne]